MRRGRLQAVISVALAIATVIGGASPASANHTGFDKGEYQVGESAGYVELTVASSPCCPPPGGQIDYYTANASAIAGEDYEQTSGTLTYPAEWTIRVPIIGDEVFEGDEQFEVRLTNYRGASVPDRPTTVVRILDDDPKPSSQQTAAGLTSSGSVGPGAVASASGQSSGGSPTLLAEEPPASGARVIADTTETGEAQGLAFRSAAEHKNSPFYPAPLIALSAVLMAAGAAFWARRHGGFQKRF